jgi:cell division protein FtsX
MGVSKWDVFAVKQYPFTLNKTSSFFTLLTILLSIIIVFLAVYLNMSTVCHLWLSRQQLPITLAQTLTYPSELTSTRFCYRPKLANASLPTWKVMDASLNQIELPSVSSTQILKENPSL